MLEIQVTQALAHEAQSNRRQALTALERAISLAQPEGYLRTFTDEGEQIRLMTVDFRLQFENRASPLLACTDRLLAAFPQTPISNQIPEMRESLTDRELEVLRLIAQGFSNTEISQRLYLALSTVKGHNQSIFDKLQAQIRTGAVARARKLGLL